MKKFAFPIILILIVVAMIGLFAAGNKSSTQNQTSQAKVDQSGLPGLMTGKPPWPNNTDKLGDRLDAIGLPRLETEGTVLHIHQHLDVYVDGKAVEIPQGIGIPNPETYISVIHTHTSDGVLHVESPTQQDYFLGQFFDIWGLKFDSSNLGGNSATGDKKVQVFVNGQKYTGDPRKLKLDAHLEILVAYGTDSQLPNPIPASYQFPEGL